MVRPGGLEEWCAIAAPPARALVEAASAIVEVGRAGPADVEALRRIGPPDLVPVALELASARRRARRRLDDAEHLIVDVEGVEQASGSSVARHKARRFAALGPDVVFDLCCGIGGDTIELCAAMPGADVIAMDVDPIRAWMAEHNSGCRSIHGDVASMDVCGQVFHVDPARRVEGGRDDRRPRRLRRLEDYRPGLDVLTRLADTARAGAIKLGPGVSLEDVPEGADRELEFIGDDGGLVQAVLWCGALAEKPGARTVTRLESGITFSAVPRPLEVSADSSIGRHVLIPDAALERAGLVGARAPAGALEIAPGLGLLTADEPVDDPWFRSFEVCDVGPWRIHKLRAALRAHGAGLVRVKIRGGVADANQAERLLRCDQTEPLWVLGFRIGARAVGVVAREVQSGSR